MKVNWNGSTKTCGVTSNKYCLMSQSHLSKQDTQSNKIAPSFICQHFIVADFQNVLIPPILFTLVLKQFPWLLINFGYSVFCVQNVVMHPISFM